MKLKLSELKDKSKWEEAGFNLPLHDIEAVKEKTLESPQWVHFGAGNIFRAFLAKVQQDLLDQSVSDRGIAVVGGDSIETIYQDRDNLSLLVTLKVDGSIEKNVLASIAESLVLDSANERYWSRLKEIFASPSLEMASFTITEKGYNLKDPQGNYLPEVTEDFREGFKAPKSFMGKLSALVYERYRRGALGLALVSMDNMSSNGARLHEVVADYANNWLIEGHVDKGFVDYVNDPSRLAFPWTMIDKITPRPDDSVREMLKEVGFEDVEDLVTARGSFVSPFVNAEEPQYLVVEDSFPNGRPSLDKAGIIFTDRKTVSKAERMKVTTCLNPLHTSLAVFGCLLGYNLISEEMKDEDLRTLVEKIGYEEAFPVVVNPGILDPKDFIKEVLEVRFPNPFIPDSPQRIATDTSQKLAIRFGETIKAYKASDKLDAGDLKLIPLVLAAWLRYLMGLDDRDMVMELSSDPMLSELTPIFSKISLGDKGPFTELLRPILSNKAIFGLDLYEAGLAGRVETYFMEMIEGPGAVRRTLQKYLYS